MNNLLKILLIILIFSACQNQEIPKENLSKDDINTERTEIDNNSIESNNTNEIEFENQHLIGKNDLSELEYLISFIPKEYKVLDFEYGDLNLDDLTNDVVLIAHNPNAELNKEDQKRLLFLFMRNSEGKLILEKRNDNVVLCSNCGGVIGDPYQDIVIKNGYFSIEHYGGSAMRWTDIITFKYNKGERNWFLHKKGGEHFHMSNPKETKEKIKTKKDFGTILFENYK